MPNPPDRLSIISDHVRQIAKFIWHSLVRLPHLIKYRFQNICIFYHFSTLKWQNFLWWGKDLFKIQDSNNYIYSSNLHDFNMDWCTGIGEQLSFSESEEQSSPGNQVHMHWNKISVFWFRFHWNWFPWIQLMISQHWLTWWLDAGRKICHYLDQSGGWSSLQRHIPWSSLQRHIPGGT